MAFTEFPAFPQDVFTKFAHVPTVAALEPVAQLKWSELAKAAENLSAVREADANAESAIDTSEVDAAVKYRAGRDKLAEKNKAAAAELAAEIERVKAAHAEKYANLNKGNELIKELRDAAKKELMQEATKGIDVAALSDFYIKELAKNKTLFKAITDQAGIDEFKLPTVTQVIKGGRTNKDGEKAGWRPRFDRMVIDGTEVTGVEGPDGKVKSPRFTDAAKVTKLSTNALLGALNEATGYAFSWDSVTLASDGSFTFPVGRGGINGGDPLSVQVWPRVSAGDDVSVEDSSDSEDSSDDSVEDAA